MLQRLTQHFRSDLAVDLGAAQTRIGAVSAGLVVDEPSIIALAESAGRTPAGCCAFGHLAWQMLGRTGADLAVVRPLAGGAVSDIRLAAAMLRHFLRKAQPAGLRLRPRVLAGVPASLSSVERQALVGSLHRAGAGEVWLMPSTMAAAVGCGLPIREPLASMVCILGASTTEAAVLTMGGVAASHAQRTGGDAFDQAICDALRRQHRLIIGLQAAEQLRIELAGGLSDRQRATADVRGCDARSGQPRSASITGEELRLVLDEPLLRIAETIQNVIDRLSPELAADLTRQGMVLCGGVAQMDGIDRFLCQQTGVGVRRSATAPRAVADGLVACLEHFALWRPLLRCSEEDF